MVCMLALGENIPNASFHRRWERKSGLPVSLPFFFCVFAVSGVESVFVPFVFGLRCIGIKLVVTKECYPTGLQSIRRVREDESVSLVIE